MPLKNKINGLFDCLKFDNKWQLLAARIFSRKTRFVPHRLNQVEFIADHFGGDECSIRPCLVGGMYDPFLNATGLDFLSKKLRVADIGANCGGFSLIFPVRGFCIDKIVAVELNPTTFSRLQMNLLMTCGSVAVVVNSAITGSSGNVSIKFSAGGTGDSISSLSSCDRNSFEIKSLTLDELLDIYFPNQKIDLIKLDVEGSEWDILQSGTCKRLHDVQNLIVEIHARDRLGVLDFSRLLEPFGLKMLNVRNPNEPDVFLFARNYS